MNSIDPRIDLVALHDALDSAGSAAWAAEGGDRDAASLALMEASAASASAFAPGSREADALGIISPRSAMQSTARTDPSSPGQNSATSGGRSS